MESDNRKYDRAIGMAYENVKNLTDALIGIGFKKDDIKTTKFTVDAKYDDSSNEKVIKSYDVIHEVKIGIEYLNGGGYAV